MSGQPSRALGHRYFDGLTVISRNVSNEFNLLRVLEGRGWKERSLERLLGLNWLRLFKQTAG